MVPKYMVDKSFGKSLYSSDFNGEKVLLYIASLRNDMTLSIPLEL